MCPILQLYGLVIQHGEQLVDADYSIPEGMNKMAEKVAMFKLATGALIKVCMCPPVCA